MKASVDITAFLDKIDYVSEAVAMEAYKTVQEAAEIGAATARYALDIAETDWGRYRMSIGQGNSAGRNDTGSMIHDLEALPVKVTANEVYAEFGWVRGRSQKYYAIQELGDDAFNTHIQGAHSLLDGRREVLNQMPRLIKNLKQRITRKVNKK
jgi:hypothetical protein